LFSLCEIHKEKNNLLGKKSPCESDKEKKNVFKPFCFLLVICVFDKQKKVVAAKKYFPP